VTIDGITDEAGHQIPNSIYPGTLDSAELMKWVERFYAEYYFRPRTAWRIVRKAIFNGPERRRLYKEAREYMAFRSQRSRLSNASGLLKGWLLENYSGKEFNAHRRAEGIPPAGPEQLGTTCWIA
jgi:hypothetical protein